MQLRACSVSLLAVVVAFMHKKVGIMLSCPIECSSCDYYQIEHKAWMNIATVDWVLSLCQALLQLTLQDLYCVLFYQE